MPQQSPEPLSCYVMTLNSARRLDEVLRSVAGIADELVVVDSGSGDDTERIALERGSRFISHPFKDFVSQRQFSLSMCSHRWVLALDSDEVVSPELATRLDALKQNGFETSRKSEAFGIRREWFVLGQRVHCFYPSSCPDYPVRLFDREKAFYSDDRRVHEKLCGFSRAERIDEPLLHYTCDSVHDLYGKLNQYSTLAAKDLAGQGVSPKWLDVLILPWLVHFWWWTFKGGWRDGSVGLIHGRYVRDMVYQKRLKLRLDIQRDA